jgi:DNA-binding MarR family transcriptional regulator
VPKVGQSAKNGDRGQLLDLWHQAVPNDRLAHLVKLASRAFERSLQSRLTAHNVALGHWTFLRILWVKDGQTQQQLSMAAGVMAPTALVALRSMEELGYIERRRRPENRKSIYVHLTPTGKRLRKSLVPLAEESNAVAVKGLTDSDLALMRRCLLTMVENMVLDASV